MKTSRVDLNLSAPLDAATRERQDMAGTALSARQLSAGIGTTASRLLTQLSSTEAFSRRAVGAQSARKTHAALAVRPRGPLKDCQSRCAR
jgi:hypothetical protein